MADTRTIIIDDPAQLAGVYEAIAKSVAALDFQQAFERRISPLLAGIHKGYFSREESPAGESWPQWYFRALDAPAEHKTLHVSGALERSLTDSGPGHVEDAQAKELTWGTSVPYSAQHQTGGEFPVDQPLIGRQGGFKRAGDTINLPQREHVGLNEAGADQVAEIIADDAIRQLQGF